MASLAVAAGEICSAAATTAASASAASAATTTTPTREPQQDACEASSATSNANSTTSTAVLRPRANVKGKHLIRSQALRESHSPPRAPAGTGPAATDCCCSPTATTTTTIPPIVIAAEADTNATATATTVTLPANGNSATGSANSTANPTPTPTLQSPKSTSPQPTQLRHAITTQAQQGSAINMATTVLIGATDPGASPAFLDEEFPKLAQPKGKAGRGGAAFKSSPVNGSTETKKPHLLEVSSIVSAKVPLLSQRSTSSDKETGGSHSCHAGTDCSSSDNCAGCSAEEMPARMAGERNKKMRSAGAAMAGAGGAAGGQQAGGLFVKGTKPRLKSMGSSASTEEVISSGFISRDDSFEQYTDANGVDLLQFFKETLNKNTKDRNTLMRIEKDLMALAMDRSRNTVKFPPMSSYNRMLIHRTAAYFGMEHNVDASQQCVIAGITKATRVPEVRFRSLVRDDEPRKSILKRESQSFDEYRRGMLRSSTEYRGGLLDRKAKSFEERDEDYERVKLRIFKKREAAVAAAAAEADGGPAGSGGSGSGSRAESYWPSWGGSDSSEHEVGVQTGLRSVKSYKGSRLLKVHSLSVDSKPEGRPPVTKSHSFGGYGPASAVHKGHHNQPHGSRLFGKPDSLATSWRLSPSSSGYKTQTQSIRSDSVTPSPTGYESGGDQTPEPQQAPTSGATGGASGVVWAVTDMAAVPPGSVLINPQTLQPLMNQDGSIYRFDPDNLPLSAHSRQSKPPIVDEADELAEAIECAEDEDDGVLRVDTQSIDQDQQCQQQPLLGAYPVELYAPPVEMHVNQPGSDQHSVCIDAGSNMHNYELSCELTTIEHQTSEMTINTKAELLVDNLSIIPEDGQPLPEVDASMEYDHVPGGTVHYPPQYPPETSMLTIPKSGVQYFTYPAVESSDLSVAPPYLVPVYDHQSPPDAVGQQQQQQQPLQSSHHHHNHSLQQHQQHQQQSHQQPQQQQHQHQQPQQQHQQQLQLQHSSAGGNGAAAVAAVYAATTPSANMAPTILPLAYPPTMFHNAAAAAAASAHPGATQLVYATATPMDANGVPLAGGAQSGHQYFTIPMGYPYAYNDPAYAQYWPNPMTYYVPQAVAQSATDPTAPAQYHSTASYPVHPQLVSSSATAATAYTLATTKRASPSQQQQHHQQQQQHHHHHHQQQQLHNHHGHHLHHHQSQHHQQHQQQHMPQFTTATSFNASLSFAPNQTVPAYVAAAASAAVAAATGGAVGADGLIKGLYPIAQPLYHASFVHQAYQQQQQQQQQHQQQPQYQQQQQQQPQPQQHQQPQQQQPPPQQPPLRLPSQQQQSPTAAPIAPATPTSHTPTSSVHTTITTNSVVIATAVALQSPPPPLPLPAAATTPPQSVYSAQSSVNGSPAASTPTPTATPTSVAGATAAQSPSSASSAHSNPPYEPQSFKPTTAAGRYAPQQHHYPSADRAAGSGDSANTNTSSSAAQHYIRKQTTYYNNGSGYAGQYGGQQQHGGGGGAMYGGAGAGARGNGARPHAEQQSYSPYNTYQQQQQQQQPASSAAGHASGGYGGANSSYSYHKNQFRFHVPKRDAGPSPHSQPPPQHMSGPTTPTTSQPPYGGHQHYPPASTAAATAAAAAHFQFQAQSAGVSVGVNGGSGSSFRSQNSQHSNSHSHSQSHNSNSNNHGGSSYHQQQQQQSQLGPMIGYHHNGEPKYRGPGPGGPRVPKMYLGNKYNANHPHAGLPPTSAAVTASAAATALLAQSQPKTTRSSPPSSVHSAESPGGNSGAGAGNGGGGGNASAATASGSGSAQCDSPPHNNNNNNNTPGTAGSTTATSNSSSAAVATAAPAATSYAAPHSASAASSRNMYATPMGAGDMMASVSAANHAHAQLCYGGGSSAAVATSMAAMAAGYASGPSGGMYVKLGQAFFAHHPSLTFANHHHHRTKMYSAKDGRAPMGHHHLSEILPSMNMMLATPRLMNPRATSSHQMAGRNARPR